MKDFLIKLLGGYTEQDRKKWLSQINSKHHKAAQVFKSECQLFASRYLRARNGHTLKLREHNQLIETAEHIVVVGDHAKVKEVRFSKGVLIAPWVDRDTISVKARILNDNEKLRGL